MKMLRELLLVAVSLHMLLLQPACAYTPKDILADMLLTDLLNNMDQSNNNYFDMEDLELPTKNVDLVSRSSSKSSAGGGVGGGATSGVDEYEYRNMFGGGSGSGGGGGGASTGDGSSNPSIRDQEYLHHSAAALWGHQYISGGMGEAPYSTIIKTDQSLPAYCNPPNPCPHGYEESQGCIESFDNTAIFSREYQARQECTCDREHMFDCAAQDNNVNTHDMEKFLMHQFQNENAIESNAVVKKTYPLNGGHKSHHNPYLQGDRLPIAAKKGIHIRV